MDSPLYKSYTFGTVAGVETYDFGPSSPEWSLPAAVVAQGRATPIPEQSNINAFSSAGQPIAREIG